MSIFARTLKIAVTGSILVLGTTALVSKTVSVRPLSNTYPGSIKADWEEKLRNTKFDTRDSLGCGSDQFANLDDPRLFDALKKSGHDAAALKEMLTDQNSLCKSVEQLSSDRSK